MISKIHPRMHPIALLHKIFSEEHTLESSNNKIEQCYSHRTTKQGCITIPSHYLKIIPHVRTWIFTLDNSFRHPPPPR